MADVNNAKRLGRSSPVGRAGVVALVAAAGLGASAWWTGVVQKRTAEASRIARIESAAEALTPAVAAELEAGKAARAQLVMAEVASQCGARRARVLVNGKPIADTLGKPIHEEQLDAAWDAAGAVEPTSAQDGAGHVVRRFEIPGRGPAVLELSYKPSDESPYAASVDPITLGIAGGGVFAVFVGLGWMNRGQRGARAYRRALSAVSSGEPSLEALRLGPSLGAEAAAWNAIIDELSELRQNKAIVKALEHKSTVGGGDRLTGACDALWQGVIITDADLKVAYANGAAAVMLRARREDMLGIELSKVLNDEAVIAGVRGSIAAGSRQRHTYELRQNDATPGVKAEGVGGVLRVGARAVKTAEGLGAVLVIEDVTQQRLSEESRNAFVAQAAHELRTPLTNIRLYVEELLDESNQDAGERQRAVNVINQESQRLERIVADMLSISEIEAGSYRLRTDDVRLDAVFDELKSDFASQSKEKAITLTFDLPPKLPIIRGDRDRLVLALHNLVGNAFKYTPKGGQVTVRVAVPADSKPGELVIEVIDTGIGIAPEECELVFERFYRSKDKRVNQITGTGLGLTLARQVARMHDGDITVSSQIDKGSTFTLRLPVAA